MTFYNQQRWKKTLACGHQVAFVSMKGKRKAYNQQ
jgi:hypothetical protein